MALTELEIKKAKATDKPQKLADGGGMYLFIHPNGGKYWRMDYRHAEKRKTLALGIYPTVSLLDARARREEARRLLANGSDPAVIKQAAKVAVIEQAAIVANSFKLLAIEFHTMKKPSWTEGHAKQWLLNLERYAFPSIGEKPITAIKPMEIMAIMRAMEERARLKHGIDFCKQLQRCLSTQWQQGAPTGIRQILKSPSLPVQKKITLNASVLKICQPSYVP